MSQHYTEADLLETYYTQPGESMPVMMHLAGCEECAARYERLSRKVRALAACEHDKPETFWARQRMLILRGIDARQHAPRKASLAAAAALAIILGGLATWKYNVEPAQVPATPAPAPVAAAAEPATTADDPWQSEELKDYQSMVAWESWVESDTSL
jgi:predicted anti-sigma-YlaC factor YlaD